MANQQKPTAHALKSISDKHQKNNDFACITIKNGKFETTVATISGYKARWEGTTGTALKPGKTADPDFIYIEGLRLAGSYQNVYSYIINKGIDEATVAQIVGTAFTKSNYQDTAHRFVFYQFQGDDLALVDSGKSYAAVFDELVASRNSTAQSKRGLTDISAAIALLNLLDAAYKKARSAKNSTGAVQKINAKGEVVTKKTGKRAEGTGTRTKSIAERLADVVTTGHFLNVSKATPDGKGIRKSNEIPASAQRLAKTGPLHNAYYSTRSAAGRDGAKTFLNIYFNNDHQQVKATMDNMNTLVTVNNKKSPKTAGPVLVQQIPTLNQLVNQQAVIANTAPIHAHTTLAKIPTPKASPNRISPGKFPVVGHTTVPNTQDVPQVVHVSPHGAAPPPLPKLAGMTGLNPINGNKPLPGMRNPVVPALPTFTRK